MEGSSRDYWAHQRTHLANERTFLSYLRTSAGAAGLGVLFIKVFTSQVLFYLGLLSIFCGVLLSSFGLIRFFSYRKRINGESATDLLHEHHLEEDFEKANKVVRKIDGD